MPSLTLLSHNVYWFQGAPSLWGIERQQPHPAILPALAALYKNLGVDLLALQEIPAPESLVQLQTALNMEGQYVKGGLRPSYGGGFLWRGKVGGCRDLTNRPVSPQRVFERFCVEVHGHFSGTDLTLVNVHLSSNRYAPDRQGESIRLAELAALTAAVPQADIIMGDFNAAPHSIVHQCMEDRGYWDPGATAPAQDKRVDYIWLQKKYRPALLDYRQLKAGDYTWGVGPTLLSDHPPVLVQLDL